MRGALILVVGIVASIGAYFLFIRSDAPPVPQSNIIVPASTEERLAEIERRIASRITVEPGFVIVRERLLQRTTVWAVPPLPRYHVSCDGLLSEISVVFGGSESAPEIVVFGTLAPPRPPSDQALRELLRRHAAWLIARDFKNALSPRR